MNLKQLQVDAATAQMPFQDYLLYLIANGGGGSSTSVTLADLLAALETFDAETKYIQTNYLSVNNVAQNLVSSGLGLSNVLIQGGTFYNPNNVPVFLKFYNTDAPTVGTTVPIYYIMIPALGQVVLDSTTSYSSTEGSLSIAATLGYDNGTALVTPLQVINIKYKKIA